MPVSQLRHRPGPRAWRTRAEGPEAIGIRRLSRRRGATGKGRRLGPQYAEAHGNLGAQYARLGQPARGAAEFHRAIALDPSSAIDQSNLALVLAQLGQTTAAVQWARHALQIDSTDAAGHYVLGCLLARDAALAPGSRRFTTWKRRRALCPWPRARLRRSNADLHARVTPVT